MQSESFDMPAAPLDYDEEDDPKFEQREADEEFDLDYEERTGHDARGEPVTCGVCFHEFWSNEFDPECPKCYENADAVEEAMK